MEELSNVLAAMRKGAPRRTEAPPHPAFSIIKPFQKKKIQRCRSLENQITPKGP
jgi:hypothetical protein